MLRDSHGTGHPTLAIIRLNLASSLEGQSKYEQAEREIREGLAILRRVHGASHKNVFTGQLRLAAVLYDRGLYAEAIRHAQEVWTVWGRGDALDEDRASTAWVLARILWEIDGPARDRARARELARRAEELSRGTQQDRAVSIRQWLRARPPA